MKAARRETTSHRRPEERQAQLLGCKRCGVLLEPGLVEGAPTCGRCGWPGKDRRTEMQRAEDAHAANMQQLDADRIASEKQAEQLRAAVEVWRKHGVEESDARRRVEAERDQACKQLAAARVEIAEHKQLIEDLTAQLDELAGLGREDGKPFPTAKLARHVGDRLMRDVEGGNTTGPAREAVGSSGASPAPCPGPSRATILSTGPRVVLSVKVAPWCVEWLRRESSGGLGWSASGTRGGASGYAARILESAAGNATELSVITPAGNTAILKEADSK